MKKFKKVLLILAVIFAILSLFALFIPYLIDLNRYKPKIQELVSNKINAKIDYSHARLSFFGGLGLNLKDVELVNTSSPFTGTKVFTAHNVDIRFDFLPIFSKKLVTTVYLDKPTVNIIKIGETNNLNSLVKPDSEEQKTEQNKPDSNNTGFTFVIKEFNIDDANIVYKDLTNKSSPTVLEFKNIDMTMTRQEDIINIEKLNMMLFSGQMKSHIKIDMGDKDTAYKGDCAINNMSFSEIYKSFSGSEKRSPIEGTGNINFTFNGRGTTKPVYSKSLNANGTYSVNKGFLYIDTALPVILDQIGKLISSVNIQNLLKLSIEDIKAAGPKVDKIVLDGIKGSFIIKNGDLYIKNPLSMKQGDLLLDVKIGIFTSSLNGIATFRGTEDFTKSLVASNKNFKLLLDKDGRIFVKIFLSGTLDDPIITVDTKNLLQNILQNTTKSILPIDQIKKIIPVLPF